MNSKANITIQAIPKFNTIISNTRIQNIMKVKYNSHQSCSGLDWSYVQNYLTHIRCNSRITHMVT